MQAWVFPGQGAQRRGMGADVLDRFPDLVAQADRELGLPVRDLLLRDPGDLLRQTRYAQPALFVVGALTFLDAREREPLPAYFAGHSLGEYAALFAAGVFDFAAGLRMVRRRGELMGEASGGGMLAVLGLDAGRVAELAAEHAPDVDPANVNAPDQVVLSGPRDSLGALAPVLTALPGVRCVPLNVSAAFHSRYMAGAAEEFRRVVEAETFADPVVPVVANVTGEPYAPGRVAALLAEQIVRPVQWARTVDHLRRAGVDELRELGPGTVLTGLWRKALERPLPPPPAPPVPTTRVPATPVPVAPPPPTPAPVAPGLRPEDLGSAEFRADYGLRYAYLAGSMYHGISSVELVLRMARAGLMGFFGAGGLREHVVEEAVARLSRELGRGGRFGVNLLHGLDDDAREHALVSLCLRHDVRHVEAAGYAAVTAPVVRFRFSGAHHDEHGNAVAVRHVLAKVSRPEVAAAFMGPPPRSLLDDLVARGHLTRAEAAAAIRLPVAGDVCVESDSAGHTDGGVALTLLPAMCRLRDEVMAEQRYARRVRVGAAGGLGSPEAVAAVFLLGAEFVVTGSINQCTPEAGVSDDVKDLLAGLDVQDTAYAPAGDMFELGARVQVARRGTLFAARATRLYELYRRHGSLEELDAATVASLESRFFRRPLAEVWRTTEEYLRRERPADLERALRDPRARMAQVFRAYFVDGTRAALRGGPGERVNAQVHTGPAMGSFNRYLKGTELAHWRKRHVDVLASRLMEDAVSVFAPWLRVMAGGGMLKSELGSHRVDA
ncbi:ACP S-malonyltransferase [Saccharothrix yanglingensis]|uniref:[acyl-carrier-protein] S-malonyltransferase n=1 Tax=Saccharothrix yanglingensis TaxID=659496 RepID=A0ABU0WVT8_9PSEU|nr:ACP S-malonyltransferase [Saccharothrix yanglingensis]MDQ2583623.1 [acyl-carrier-protein] S-malonyltransferase [Saccharothrix yanglingensis]